MYERGQILELYQTMTQCTAQIDDQARERMAPKSAEDQQAD